MRPGNNNDTQQQQQPARSSFFNKAVRHFTPRAILDASIRNWPWVFIERAEVARVQEIATYLNGEIASILEKVPLAALIDVDTAEILLFFSLHIVLFMYACHCGGGKLC
jgi:hypothetical protein